MFDARFFVRADGKTSWSLRLAATDVTVLAVIHDEKLRFYLATLCFLISGVNIF